MSDNGTGQDKTPDGTASVTETAAILGISTDAVRKRLIRGTLSGHKVSGVWRIALDSAPDIVQDTGRTRRASEPDTPSPAIDDLRDTVTDLRGRLDWSQSEVSGLRAEMSEQRIEAAEQRRRADTLQAMNQTAQDRIRELESLTSGIHEAVGSPRTNATAAGDSGHDGDDQHSTGNVWQRLMRALRMA